MRALSLMLAGIIVFSGCDDDAAGGGTPVDLNMTPAPTVPTTATPAAPQARPNQLQIEGANQMTGVFGDMLQLRVQYLNGMAQPIANAPIRVRIDGPAPVGYFLTPMGANTAADGRAAFQLTAGNVATTLRVFAEADGAQPVFWRITIQPSPLGRMNVRVIYDGNNSRYNTSLIAAAQVRIVEGSCEAVLGGTAQAVLTSQEIPVFDGDEAVLVSNVPSERAFAVVAWGRTLQGRNLARGCVDEIVEANGMTSDLMVTGGAEQMVTVDLDDLPMEYKGIYEVEHHIDLAEILESSSDDNIAQAVNIIELVGSIGGGNPDAFDQFPRGDGFILTLCDEDFLDLDSTICGLLRTFGASAIQDLLDDQAAQNPGLFQALDIIGDLWRLVADFNVYGSMEFSASRPTEEGYLLRNLSRFRGIKFVWRDNCPSQFPSDCEREFPFQDASGNDLNVIEGLFDAQVLEENRLAIGRHQLQIRYGTLIILALENWILPLVYQVDVDGDGMYDDRVGIDYLFSALMDCSNPNNIISRIIGSIGGNSTVQGAGQNFCTTAAALLGQLTRTALLGLNDSLEAITLEGQVWVADDYPNLRADRLYCGVWNGAFGTVEAGTQEENVEGMMVPVPLEADLVLDVGTFEGCLQSECDLLPTPAPNAMMMMCPE